MNLIKAKKLIFDFGINILASFAITVTLQILIYPLIAKNVSIETYGIILTIMGIVNTIIVALGNTLNNVRLVQNQDYESRKELGDFNIILIATSIVGVIISIIVMLTLKNISILNILLITLSIVFGIARSYYLVGYRINLNFLFNLYCNLVISLGYLIGFVIFHYTNIWSVIFLIGEIFGCFFLFLTTDVVREPLKITTIFRKTLSKYFILIATGAMATILTYMDRLIIFPVLGGEAVSTFTVASFFGKTIGMVMIPISGVLLGYYSQKSFKFTIKIFWLINIVIIVFSAIFFAVSLVLSSWVTKLLYPTLFESAKEYIIIANLAAIIGMISNITQPSVLKFAPMFWQLIIQGIYSIIYIGLGTFMLKLYGIYGFCVGIMIANVFKLILLYIIGNFYIKRGI
ncbi:hypothetical protein [Clostridium intestinale]|uniref:Oligosaccharide flippase family protein n=1 Tax=Clostridium intestinale TaxID=36845 RepID=A0A7D6VZ97_9CLOT|nr:hypothetical protein [Clostridium intestinale]QLY79105.1 hypothetical protein HZF06_18760 [Clostridium intestinale]